MNFSSSSEPNEIRPSPRRLKIPRIESLQHKLQRAKDANGRPIPLRDELLFFLDDPPPGTGDRWQKGADLCRSHGIETSRMSVWRFYRAEILQWRREQIQPATPPASDPEEIARLQEQARHLAAQRALETLHDPALSPGHLIGLLQNDNHRRQIQLARDQFEDRVAVRRGLEKREHYRQIENQIRDQQLAPAQAEVRLKILSALAAVPPHTTS